MAAENLDQIGQQARWLEQLEELEFVVEHRPGARHGNADALSRRTCPQKNSACKDPGQPPFGGPADQPTFTAGAVASSELSQVQPQQDAEVPTQHRVRTPSDAIANVPVDLFNPGVLVNAQKDIQTLLLSTAKSQREKKNQRGMTCLQKVTSQRSCGATTQVTRVTACCRSEMSSRPKAHGPTSGVTHLGLKATVEMFVKRNLLSPTELPTGRWPSLRRPSVDFLK